MGLTELRQSVRATYGWINPKTGQRITEAQYDALPSDTDEAKRARTKYQWRPEAKAVAALCAAERAETRRVYEASLDDVPL